MVAIGLALSPGLLANYDTRILCACSWTGKGRLLAEQPGRRTLGEGKLSHYKRSGNIKWIHDPVRISLWDWNRMTAAI